MNLPNEMSSPRRHATLGEKLSGPALIASLALLLIVVAGVYWAGLDGGFAFDDKLNILENHALHVNTLAWRDWVAAIFSSSASDLQRPLAMLTFATNHYFTGLDPWPMKLTNLGVHLLNTLLVFGLARSTIDATLTGKNPGTGIATTAGLMVAACWALHPINVTAVLYVVQRMESLCHVFVFAGLWLYVSGRRRQLDGRPGWTRILIGLVMGTLLGVLTKESAALLPLYAFGVEVCVFRFRGAEDNRDGRLYLLYAGFLLLPALVGLVWLWPKAVGPDAYASRGFSLGERLLTEPHVVLDYLRWTLLPDLRQLSLYHDDYPVSHGLLDPPGTLFGLLAIPALLAIAWLAHVRRPLTCLGIFWFLGAQLLTATFIPLELVFEHRNYFASLGVCLILADVLLIAPGDGPGRRVGNVIAIMFLLLCASTTFLRANEWSNPVRFAWSEAAKRPQSPRATYTLARMLIGIGGYDPHSRFVADIWKSLEQARRAPGTGILPVETELVYAARSGAALQPAWWEEMQGKLRSRPTSAEDVMAVSDLSDCAVQGFCAFPPDDMLQTFAAALSRQSNPAMLNVFAGYSLQVMDDSGLALKLWREASSLSPRVPQYHISLANLLIELGRFDEAGAEIARLRKLGLFGQNEADADALDAKLRAAIESNRGSAISTPLH